MQKTKRERSFRLIFFHLGPQVLPQAMCVFNSINLTHAITLGITASCLKLPFPIAEKQVVTIT